MKIADEILCRSHMSEIRIMNSYENYMRSHIMFSCGIGTDLINF